MRRIAVVLCSLALAGCTSLRIPLPPAAPGTVPIGGTATIGAVHVRPLELLEDSRCPARVQCVWAGRVRILAEITYRGGSEQQRGEIILGKPFPLPEGDLLLVAVAPEPVAGRAIDRSEYRLTFRLATR